MSTTPDPQPEALGLELSALRAYSGPPGAIKGVGFWPRALARVIDLLVHMFVSFCAGILFSILLVIAAGGHPNPLVVAALRKNTIGVFVLALLGSVAYEAICEGMHGSTLGKLLLSMVVVQEDGSPCRFGAALIRSVAYFVDALFFGLIGYLAMQKSPQEQRHGDEWAHTVVCKRPDAPSGSLRGSGLFFAAFLLAAMADAALAMVGLLLKLNA